MCRDCWRWLRSCARPGSIGLTLPRVVNEQQFVVTDIGSQLDLRWPPSSPASTSTPIYAYNPGYNRWSTDPNGPHRW